MTDSGLEDTMNVGGAMVDATNLTDLPVQDPELYADRTVLSQGGMGRIFTARDRRLRRTVAIKELLSDGVELRARFAREVLLTARLQHPSIVGIHEAGRWPGGEPFYAMVLVRGRPLDELVGEARTLEQRMALLPHVIAVADALGYAHTQRVLHRDLKPQNVMVGSHGETVVIDWGLAKDLSEVGSQPEPTGPYRESGDGLATSAGNVMGTPMYMPPEQARGEAVDERADVYAIGAILYHLLAGTTPFTGSSSYEVLANVIVGPPPPLENHEPRLAPDLVAIVRRAMAREPAERYATGRELAEDLRRFQAGQLVGAHRYTMSELLRRWLRRHRAILAVTALAVVTLAVVGVLAVRRVVAERETAERQRAIAEREREAAVTSRSQADDLIDFLLFDLKGRLELLGRLDLLDKVASKAGAYYGDQPRPSRVDERKRSVALEAVGDVLLGQGKTADALVRYRVSQQISERLAADVARDEVTELARRDTAVSHIKIGDVIAAQGDGAASIVEYRSAVSGAEALAGPNAEILHSADLATARERLAGALATHGDRPGALREARAARELRARVVAVAPRDPIVGEALAISAIQLGDLTRDDDLEAALTEYRTAISQCEELVRRDATNAVATRTLGVAHERIASVLELREDVAGALAERRLAAAISERLAAADPTSAAHQRDLATDRSLVGISLAASGDAANALVEFRAALAIRMRFAAADGASADAKRDLELGHENLGNGLLPTDPAAALVEYRAAALLAGELAAADATSTERRRDLEVSRVKVGEALVIRADRAGAQAEFEAAREIARALATSDPSRGEWTADLALVSEHLGDLALAANDNRAARDAYIEVLALRDRLHGTHAQARHDLAGAHDGLGEALAGLGDAPGARREREAAIAILETLVADQPQDRTLATELATLRTKLASGH